MFQIVGLVIYFGLKKKLKTLYKDKKSTIVVLITAIILNNLSLRKFLGNSDAAEIIEGFFIGAIIMSVYTLITGKYRQEETIRRKAGSGSQKSASTTHSGQNVMPSANHEGNEQSHISNQPSHENKIRETALWAVSQYLKNRNYRVLNDPKKDFDLITFDNRDIENKITVIAFEFNNNNNLISFDKDRFEELVKLGRAHKLFVVTNCQEDDDAEYLGNYVTIYCLDSSLDETGFTIKGDRYTNTLRMIKKYSYDQEICVKI